MRKISQFFSLAFASLFVTGLAWAAPEALPANAKVLCAANNDGTGTLTISGVDVKHVELYIHAPVAKKSILDSASNYVVSPATTFNFVFRNTKSQERYALLGSDTTRVEKVFTSSQTTDATFDGVTVVPDADNGGIGGPGASMACTHMLRAKKSS